MTTATNRRCLVAEDRTTSSFAPIIVKDGSALLEEFEAVSAEGRELSNSSGYLVSVLDPGATTLEPRARRRR